MTISYVVDVYRRVYTPTDNLLDFALFVALLPAPGGRARSCARRS